MAFPCDVVVALTVVRTIEWSLPKNSFATAQAQMEIQELDTRTRSNKLHIFCPDSEKWVGVVAFRTTKSCFSMTSTTALPLPFVHLLPLRDEH